MLTLDCWLKGAGKNYRVFGSVLHSVIDLPSLVEADESPGLEFTLCDDLGTPGLLLHEWRTGDGDLSISAWQSGDGSFALYLPGGGTFYVNADLDSIACAPNEAATEATIEHLLLDQVLPRLLAQKGQVVLHGSAVQLASGEAVAFLGETGAGKSTLAAAFSQSGDTLLTDDSFAVELAGGAPFIAPGYGGLRLWDDTREVLLADAASRPMAHYSSKRRIDMQVASTEPAPLKTLFLLDDASDSTVITPITSSADMVMALMKVIFALDIRDPACHRKWLNTIETTIRTVDVRRLAYPRALDQLEEVVEDIRQAV